jgi:hypothetical protein
VIESRHDEKQHRGARCTGDENAAPPRALREEH